eukprot:sb/3475949/
MCNYRSSTPAVKRGAPLSLDQSSVCEEDIFLPSQFVPNIEQLRDPVFKKLLPLAGSRSEGYEKCRQGNYTTPPAPVLDGFRGREGELRKREGCKNIFPSIIACHPVDHLIVSHYACHFSTI